ncbi:MAG: hypothetical protein PUD07_05830 [bacterium]|nr:hypothetical protein [bacterium]
MLNEYLKKIETYKEMLSALPKNNDKNKKIYIEKINEIILEQNEIKNSIIKEIKKRKDKYCNINKNEKISSLNNNILSLKNKIILSNPYASAYEKSHLDKYLYNLTHYYKTDLDSINNTIKNIFEVFKNVDIILNKEDFNYSYYTHEIMKVFLDTGCITKELFDSIYWKCPDIITHISLNFKYLYYLNEKRFNNYYNTLNIDNTVNLYKDLLITYENLIESDKYTILNSFINKNKNIKDYNNAVSLEKSIFNDKYNENDAKELYHSLIEYKYFNELSFIIHSIKDIYQKKDQNKGVYLKTKKEIQKNEKKLFKENKKIYYLISKNKQDKIDYYNNLINNNINNLENLYENLEKSYFNEIIISLKDDTTIYDILLLALSNYNFLIELFKEKDYDYDLYYKKLFDLVYYPYNNLITNLWINDNKDIEFIIIDKYNLYGYNLNKEMLNLDNIDGLIKNIKIIIESKYLEKYNITDEKINFINIANELQ